jgi:hypothetical protein
MLLSFLRCASRLSDLARFARLITVPNPHRTGTKKRHQMMTLFRGALDRI